MDKSEILSILGYLLTKRQGLTAGVDDSRLIRGLTIPWVSA
jgi:hypothetical protein